MLQPGKGIPFHRGWRRLLVRSGSDDSDIPQAVSTHDRSLLPPQRDFADACWDEKISCNTIGGLSRPQVMLLVSVLSNHTLTMVQLSSLDNDQLSRVLYCFAGVLPSSPTHVDTGTIKDMRGLIRFLSAFAHDRAGRDGDPLTKLSMDMSNIESVAIAYGWTKKWPLQTAAASSSGLAEVKPAPVPAPAPSQRRTRIIGKQRVGRGLARGGKSRARGRGQGRARGRGHVANDASSSSDVEGSSSSES